MSLYVATQPGLNSQQCLYYSDCRVRQSSALSRWVLHIIFTLKIRIIKNFIFASFLLFLYLVCVLYGYRRNEELQEQLWAISTRDVRGCLTPEARHRFCGREGQSSALLFLSHTRRHLFKSQHAVRGKPEDQQRLIDTAATGETLGDWGGNEELIEGAEEEREGE